MAPSLLALAASAGNNVLMNEKTLHKLQGAQLFVGSGVAFFFAAHRWQVKKEGGREGGREEGRAIRMGQILSSRLLQRLDIFFL
jgi:hypothetical protein